LTETNVTATHRIPDEALQTDGAAWSVRVLKVEEGSVFGSTRIEAPRRFRYITLTLEYVYLGAGLSELYPETVALAYTGTSPLQGLTEAPLVFQSGESDQAVWLADRSIAVAVAAKTLQHATFVFEFHHNCREFRLYFPGCEGITITLPHPPAPSPNLDQHKSGEGERPRPLS
jgi:hypothetical protein